MPQNIEQSWLLFLHERKRKILEFVLNCWQFEVFDKLSEFGLRPHHESWKHDVPIIVNCFRVVLEKVSESQACVQFDLLVRVWVCLSVLHRAFVAVVIFSVVRRIEV